MHDLTKPQTRDQFSMVEQESGLWRVDTSGSGGHYSLLLLSSQGALVTDPSTPELSDWLIQEVKTRFDSEVRWVVYSHSHYDHIGGGGVLQDAGAKVVAHVNAAIDIAGEELVTGMPDIAFEKSYAITLDHDEVILNWIAPSHSNSMIMIEFARQGLLLATDFCPIRRVPYYDFPDFYYDGWMKSLYWIADHDFTFLGSGHWDIGIKSDLYLQIDYMTNLHDEVLRLVRSGKGWDEIYKLVRFSDEHRALGSFLEMWFANVLGMYRWVSTHRRGAY